MTPVSQVSHLALLGVVYVACIAPVAAEDSRPPSSASPSTRFEHDMMVRLHMHESFDLLRAIQKLLVRGRLEDARAFARAIAEAPDEPGLGPWAAQAAQVRARAAELASARGLDDACRRIAQLADACGGCHVATTTTPEFRAPGRIPTDQPTIEARMARHLWATDRLWEGLVGGDDDAWRTGLDVLAAAPLREAAPTGPRAQLARRLQTLAGRARTQRQTDAARDRARVYGEILVTCTGCHTFGVAPDPAR